MLTKSLFTAGTEEINDYFSRKSPTIGNRINDVFKASKITLKEDGISYNGVYDIEVASGLEKGKDDK